MKIIFTITAAGLFALVAGCATSTQVQEMIDASYQDFRAQSSAHETSIDILKQSSVVTLKKSQDNAAVLTGFRQLFEEAQGQLKNMQGDAEAAKVMSAANTIKVADLDDLILGNKEMINEVSEKTHAIDALYEEVMIRHFKMISESADAAISALQADNVAPTAGIQNGLAEPFEIVAPDTTATMPDVTVE